MEKKTKSWLSLLNPLGWINAAFALLATVFGPILRWLGMLNPPSTTGFENLTKADVEDAKQLAEQQEAAVDAITREMSPAEVVRAYAKADAVGRTTMDLSVLDFAEQDWLLGLSDEDLHKLGMSTTSGCARSLQAKEVLPIYAKPQPETEAAEIYSIPTEAEIEDTKREQIAALFRQVQRELWLAPGVPNVNPKHTPATLH